MTRIIVPTDFTKAADIALKQATVIALKTKAEILLLHVVDAKSPITEASEKLLKTESSKISEEYGLQCSYLLKAGNVFDVITSEISQTPCDLVVIGTHGAKGLRQALFGADILKLVSKIPAPVLVVQEDTIVSDGINKIILPICSHDGFRAVVDAVIQIARLFNSEVHLYSINKPGFEWTGQMKKNIEKTMNIFKAKAIAVIRVKEEQKLLSIGYAKQTLNYAKSVNADAVCMMSVPSSECYYFAAADKETMIENELNIPVLFAGGGS